MMGREEGRGEGMGEESPPHIIANNVPETDCVHARNISLIHNCSFSVLIGWFL